TAINFFTKDSTQHCKTIYPIKNVRSDCSALLCCTLLFCAAPTALHIYSTFTQGLRAWARLFRLFPEAFFQGWTSWRATNLFKRDTTRMRLYPKLQRSRFLGLTEAVRMPAAGTTVRTSE